MTDLSSLSDAEILAAAKGQSDYSHLSNEEVLQAAGVGQGQTGYWHPEQLWSGGPNAVEMVKNIPSSATDFAKGIWNTVRHPINTLGALSDLASGTVEQGLAHAGLPKLGDTPQADVAANVGKYLMSRYGSKEGFKNALEADPVGVLADASMLFTGGESAAAKIPELAGAADKAASLTNPLKVATKAAGAVSKKAGAATDALGHAAAETLGATTGAGGEAISGAYRAGRAGGEQAEAFTAAAKGIPSDEVVTQARNAVKQMRRDRSADYRSGMVDVSKDKTILDMKPIEEAVNDSLKVKSFKGQSLSDSTLGVQQELADAVRSWSKLDPKEFHTPEGLDALKQKIGDIRDSTQFGTPARKVASDVYNAVKDQVTQQVPAYSRVMGDYQEASEALKEVERSLSLGDKASVDAALRKLQSTMRNNVNTNYGKRLDLVKSLEQSGAPTLRSSLAGQALNQFAPRGLAHGLVPYELGSLLTLGFINPVLAAKVGLTLTAQSPRLMGQAAYRAGQAARLGAHLTGSGEHLLGDGMAAAQKLGIKDPQALGLFLSESGRSQQR